MYNYAAFLTRRFWYQVASVNPDEAEKTGCFRVGIFRGLRGIISRREYSSDIESVSTFVVMGLLVKEFFTRMVAPIAISMAFL